MTKQDRAKVIRAAESVANKDWVFTCVALDISGASHKVQKQYDHFCNPRPAETSLFHWFDDIEMGEQRQLARTLALLMFAEECSRE